MCQLGRWRFGGLITASSSGSSTSSGSEVGVNGGRLPTTSLGHPFLAEAARLTLEELRRDRAGGGGAGIEGRTLRPCGRRVAFLAVAIEEHRHQRCEVLEGHLCLLGGGISVDGTGVLCGGGVVRRCGSALRVLVRVEAEAVQAREGPRGRGHLGGSRLLAA